MLSQIHKRNKEETLKMFELYGKQKVNLIASKERLSTLALIDGMVEMVEGMKKEEIIIEGCENCGQEGYCRAWYGKGAENDPHGYGDRYYPTGSVVFCKECSNDFGLGKCWLGEEIWKKSSDLPEYDDQRLNHIKKKVKENVGYNHALSDLKSLLLAKREMIENEK